MTLDRPGSSLAGCTISIDDRGPLAGGKGIG